jgi:predicted enzyme related to lactoylglutathione lyase
MKYSGICLITQNVPKLVNFYKKVFTTDSEGDDIHADLNIGGLNLSIYSEKGMENLAPNSMKGAGNGKFTIGFEVDDIESEYLRIKELGVHFIIQPTTFPWGSRAFWFRDPDRNIIDIFSKIKKREL